MKSPLINTLSLLVIAIAFLALPQIAKADVFTFTAPATAPNSGNGGPNQFDLDHHLAYTWRLSGIVIPAGQQITGATLTITSIANWDTNPNTLFIHLLNTAQTYSSSSSGSVNVGWHTSTYNFGTQGAVTAYVDVNPNQAPVTSISDAFGADYASNPLVVGANNSSNNLLLAAPSFTTSAVTYTLNLTSAQLAQLAAYIANGNDFAFGFDSDCHFWNNGISFTFTTAPTATPEPATMLLLGSGLAGFGYVQRRRRQQKQQ